MKFGCSAQVSELSAVHALGFDYGNSAAGSWPHSLLSSWILWPQSWKGSICRVWPSTPIARRML